MILSNEAIDVQLATLANFIEQGSANATFIFYSSNIPENSSVAVNSQFQIIRLTLPKPCIKSMLNQSIELYPSESGLVTRTGIPKWARLYNGNGKIVADFELGKDITLSETTLVLGGTLTLESIII